MSEQPEAQPAGPDDPVPPKTLTEDEIWERFEPWLDEKWPEPQACPICQTAEWFGPDVVQVHNYGRGAPGGAGRHIPFLLMSCVNCGYTLFFNASTLGFTPEELDRRELS